MDSILDTELADEIAAGLEAEAVPYAITVTRTEIVGGEPWDPGSGTATPVDHPCKGWRDTYQQDVIDGTLIQASDVRIIIVAGSLDITPLTSDTVTANGQAYSIVNIKADPAGALWDMQARI